jgi:hypothetical protein
MDSQNLGSFEQQPLFPTHALAYSHTATKFFARFQA